MHQNILELLIYPERPLKSAEPIESFQNLHLCPSQAVDPGQCKKQS